MAHEIAIGDTISSIGPYCTLPSRGQLELRDPTPPQQDTKEYVSHRGT